MFTKILEKIINNKLINYLNDNNLLSQNQFEFSQRRSTNQAAHHISNHIANNLAFNLSGSILLHKLEALMSNISFTNPKIYAHSCKKFTDVPVLYL